METYGKYLSYYWNTPIDKTTLNQVQGKENKLGQKESSHVFGHVLFSLMLVIISASGLHLVEKTLIASEASMQELLSPKVVLAAELTTKAELIQQTQSLVNIKPNDAVTIILTFKNSGTSTWTSKKIYLKSLSTALKFKHESWPDPYLPAKLQEDSVISGNTGTIKLDIRAPKNLGRYTADFLLVSDNVMINGGEIKIDLNVVDDPSAVVTTTATVIENTSTAPKINVCSLKLNIASVESGLDNSTCTETLKIASSGPIVRTGVFQSNEAVVISNNKDWQVYDENDTLLASVPADLQMRFDYLKEKGEYLFDFIDQTVRTKSKLKLINFNSGIFTIVSLKDIPSWNKSINYNQFKGDFEIDYYAPKENVWVIEKLALEEYLKGIKETSDSDPIEYQRAMTIAARTYALYHVNKFKVTDSFFDLYNDERDQVYKGYVAETIMPSQANIVTETQGVVLTYANNVIVSYYSARSGGQTINVKNTPYLKSVETPYSKTYTKWGHGKGLDQVDAKARAQKLGWTFDQILKYYYSGVYIEKIY
ncbi:MAG: SpoIID/LytB domain-containing protein [Patescibacteria group bacterium]